MSVQIRKLLEDNKDGAKGEKKKYENLRDAWLLGSAQRGAAAVGKEVRLLPRWLLRLVLTVAAVQIKDLLAKCAKGEEEKYQKMLTLWQHERDRLSAPRGQDPLPSVARIQLVVDIRNHQQPSDSDQYQKLTREEFGRLITVITSSKTYGQQSFGMK